MKRKHWIIIGIIGLGLMLLPFFLNELIFDNDYISKVSNDGWASFFGSYIGGAMGGIGTLIAMYITVRQTQKQILDAENNSKMVDKKIFTDEISALVVQYISDLQIYHDKEECFILPREKLSREWSEYESLQLIFKMFREDRRFNDINSYFAKLSEQHISRDYAERFFRKIDWNNPQKLYDEYEKDLENRLKDIDSKIQNINEQFNECRQRYIIGNNTYLLLEIRLEGLDCGKKLWSIIKDLHNDESNPYYLLSHYWSEKSSFDNQIINLKKELKNFITEYMK